MHDRIQAITNDSGAFDRVEVFDCDLIADIDTSKPPQRVLRPVVTITPATHPALFAALNDIAKPEAVAARLACRKADHEAAKAREAAVA